MAANLDVVRVAVGINKKNSLNSIYIYDGIVANYSGKEDMLEELRAYYGFMYMDVFLTRKTKESIDYDWYTLSMTVVKS